MTGYGDEGYEDCQISACKLTTAGGNIKPFYYWWETEEWEDDGDIYPACKGWYDLDEDVCYNDVSLEPGEGIWLKSPSTDIKVVSAGQVAVEDIPVSLVVGNQLCPNAMPCTLKLGQAYMDGYGEDGYEDCQISACKLTTAGGNVKPFYYWWDTDEWEDDGDIYPACYGWYDLDEDECYNDKVDLKSGEALWLKSPSEEYLLHWTSPLAPAPAAD